MTDFHNRSDVMTQMDTKTATVDIESEKTYQAIRMLGFDLKVSPDKAVAIAIEEKLATMRADERVREGIAEKLVEIGRQMSTIIKNQGRNLNEEHDALYDDLGRPR
jgi:hypothetical protein